MPPTEEDRYLVCLVCLVCLVEPDQRNKPNRPNEPNQPIHQYGTMLTLPILKKQFTLTFLLLPSKA